MSHKTTTTSQTEGVFLHLPQAEAPFQFQGAGPLRIGSQQADLWHLLAMIHFLDPAL